jgi:hypothetical protein
MRTVKQRKSVVAWIYGFAGPRYGISAPFPFRAEALGDRDARVAAHYRVGPITKIVLPT